MGRFASGGVVIEPLGDRHLVRAWFPQDDQTEARRNQIEQGLWHLSQIVPFPKPRYRTIQERDWKSTLQRQLRPLRIGKRLLVRPIVARQDGAEIGTSGSAPNQPGPAESQSRGLAAAPPWNDAFELAGPEEDLAPDPDRLTLHLEPGMAFGTGRHPSTRHCLELLEQWLRPGDSVLDLGCGSGILAIAAARLGAQSVLALDIDPAAVELAVRNVRHNALHRRIRVRSGSLQQVPGDAIYDLVVANIHAAVIDQLLQQGVAARLAAEGQLIVSGILVEQIQEIEQQAVRAGLLVAQRRASGDWRSLRLVHSR